MTKISVEVIYDSYSYSEEGVWIWDKYKATRWVASDDSVRRTMISVIREAITAGVKVHNWVEQAGDDLPLSIYFVSDTVNDAQSGYEKSGFGIKYSLNEDGSIVVLDGYAPLHYDWTFGILDKLASEGHVKGDSRRLIVGTPSELGGGELGVFEWFGFLASLDTLVRLSRAGMQNIREGVQLRDVRRVAEDWQKRGIEYPHHLREFIDTKGVWDLVVLKRRLRLDDEYAILLLSSLGYEPVRNTWKLTHSKDSIKKRKAWLRNERKYMKKLELEGV